MRRGIQQAIMTADSFNNMIQVLRSNKPDRYRKDQHSRGPDGGCRFLSDTNGIRPDWGKQCGMAGQDGFGWYDLNRR
jgi:hypothetical protein